MIESPLDKRLAVPLCLITYKTWRRPWPCVTVMLYSHDVLLFVHGGRADRWLRRAVAPLVSCTRRLFDSVRRIIVRRRRLELV